MEFSLEIGADFGLIFWVFSGGGGRGGGREILECGSGMLRSESGGVEKQKVEV